MKAILLALAAGALVLGIGTWRLRRVSGEAGARALTAAFVAILPALVAGHLLSPPDLGILSSAVQIPISSVDLGFAVFLYTAGFFGGILQIYNLAERGFSLRILIDILNARSRAMTLDEVIQNYSDGKGIAWM